MIKATAGVSRAELALIVARYPTSSCVHVGFQSSGQRSFTVVVSMIQVPGRP